MTTFHVKWAVREIINGPGQHDGGIRDGDQTIRASGEIDKEAESPEHLRYELTKALEASFPPHGWGPTYDIDRVYDIEITHTCRPDYPNGVCLDCGAPAGNPS